MPRRVEGSYPGAAGIVTVALALTGVLTAGPGSYLALVAAAVLTVWLVGHRQPAHRAGRGRTQAAPGPRRVERLSEAG